MAKQRLAAAALFAVALPTASLAQQVAPVLDAMRTELTRAREALRTKPVPPYFIGYDITELREFTLISAFGAITDRSDERRRALDVQLRVGSYDFDNTHVVHADFPDFSRFFTTSADIPVDDDPMAIRAALWYETEQSYRSAVEQLTTARTNARVRVAPEDSSPDFSREAPERFIEPAAALTVDRAAWERKLRRYTAPFANQRDIYGGNAYFTASVETRWYVNSEGTEIQTSQPGYRLIISAVSKADDGMELPRYESFFARTAEELPDDQTVLRAVAKMIGDLQALRRAPVSEPYTGPAILSGRASGVFFHEILGHRLEGHRQRDEDEGQTFTRRVTDAVLPAGFSVYFDPTLRRIGSTDLAGYYQFDDEGVRARRVGVIERGVLKTFLMSRKPIEGFANSNGHGRRQVGFTPVARQSNLIVQVAAPKSRAQLKQQLLDEVRRQRKPYGLFFDDIEGGFTITQRGIPNAFEVLPVMVYRVYPDGREELIRGVDLIGTPLTVFSQITAGDDQVEVFNGMCGAESGAVPVSAVSPAVLIAQIEVQKKPKSSERSPILEAPPPTSTSSADTGDVIMRAMRDELARSMAELRLDTMPRPYFLAYRVDEVTSLDATATRGSLIERNGGRRRRLSVELRVGDYAFDNTNFLSMPSGLGDFMGEFGIGVGEVPLDDDYGALRRQLWLATDASYKSAAIAFTKKRALLANRSRRVELPDFTREPAVTIADDVPVPRLDTALVEELVRRASAVFQNEAEIHTSDVRWSGGATRTWYVNSEGTSFTRTTPWGSIRSTAETRTTDDMALEDALVISSGSPTDLPDRSSLVPRLEQFAQRLSRLRSTAPAETYNGPVLFEGAAAAELFASVFGSQLAANRMPVSDLPNFERFSGMTPGLLDRIGARVLPRTFSVTENPSLRTFDGAVIGGALVDDEGVRTRETKLVDHGVLRTLLTTRVPVEGIGRSTGSRRGTVAAPTNVFVSTDSGLAPERLRQRLVALAKANGNDYAIIVRRIGGGRSGGRGFSALMAGLAESEGPGPAIPIADAVRLYADGREEPIRGVTVAGMSGSSFRNIVAASGSRYTLRRSWRGGLGGAFAMMSFLPRSLFGHMVSGESTTYVVPALLFEDVAIRKSSGDGTAPPAYGPPWLAK